MPNDLYTATLDALAQNPVVPVLTLGDVDQAIEVGRKLSQKGYKVVETTLRIAGAVEAMKAMKAAYPDLLIGMGTVLTQKDVTSSLAAGADFIVTPGTTPALIEVLKSVNVPVFPAVATPSEAQTLYEAGFKYQKFFPAEVNGGMKALKAWSAPLPHIKFMPTGGVREDTYKNYLDLPNVFGVGGTWVAKAL